MEGSLQATEVRRAEFCADLGWRLAGLPLHGLAHRSSDSGVSGRRRAGVCYGEYSTVTGSLSFRLSSQLEHMECQTGQLYAALHGTAMQHSDEDAGVPLRPWTHTEITSTRYEWTPSGSVLGTDHSMLLLPCVVRSSTGCWWASYARLGICPLLQSDCQPRNGSTLAALFRRLERITMGTWVHSERADDLYGIHVRATEIEDDQVGVSLGCCVEGSPVDARTAGSRPPGPAHTRLRCTAVSSRWPLGWSEFGCTDA